jgi:putative heme-binding domain-containing protein
MELALEGRRLERVPAALKSWFAKAWQQSNPSLNLVRLGLRMGSGEATEAALKVVDDGSVPETDRVMLMEVLGQIGERRGVPKLLEILEKSPSGRLQSAALAALQRFSDSKVADALLSVYPRLSKELRARAANSLCMRSTWAAKLVDAVEAGRVAQSEVGFEQLRQIAGLKDDELMRRVEKRWGRVQPESPEEKRNTINRLRLVLRPSGAAGREGKGDEAAGKKLFQQNCAVCHRLFGEGNQIGPDLTGADRKNTELMLLSIVDPSAYIRPEYVSYEVLTRDDQSVNGLMSESTPAAVTILDRNNQRQVFARDRIKEIRESRLSLMPEGLLEAMTPQQLMDLFSYLQSAEAGTNHGVGN